MEEFNKQAIIDEYSKILDKAEEYMKTDDYKTIQNMVDNHKGEELTEQEKSQLSEIFSKTEFTDNSWLWALFLDKVLQHKSF